MVTQIDLDGIRQNQRQYPAGRRMPEHSHRCVQITLVLGGQIRERVGQSVFDAHALDLVVKPFGVRHENEFGPRGARTIQIEIEPDCLTHSSDSNSGLSVWSWYRSESIVRCLLRLEFGRLGRDATLHELRQLVACLSDCRDIGSTGNQVAPRWIQTVRDRIASEFDQSLRVDQLACDAGVHRVVLSRTYRSHFGQTITQRIRELRTARAAHLLSQSNLPLACVAMECGFSDQSHLTRVFKSFTGLAPGRFRVLTSVD